MSARAPAAVALALALGALALAFAPPAQAQTGAHQGFFFRAGVGPGYLSASEPTPLGDLSLSGGGVALDLALGGYVVRNLALHADLYGFGVPNPTVSLNSVGITTSNATVNAVGIGLGVTGWIVPAEVWLSASLGAARMTAQRTVGGTVFEANTGTGFALHLNVGKQWWVSRVVGLGVGADLAWFTVPDRPATSSGSSGEANTITGLGLGLRFVVTAH